MRSPTFQFPASNLRGTKQISEKIGRIALCFTLLLLPISIHHAWGTPYHVAARCGRVQGNDVVLGKDRIAVVRRHMRGWPPYPPYWAIYKRGNKTIFDEEIDHPILRDHRTGVTVVQVPNGNLYIVDAHGFVKAALNFGGVFLRSMLLKQGLLVYDSGFTYLAKFDPKTEGKHLADWLRSVRRVTVYNVRTRRQVWEASELDVGIPIACHPGRIETMRLENLSRWLVNPKLAPTATIAEFDAHNGHCVRRAVLAMSDSDARELAQQYTNSTQHVLPGHIRWSLRGVRASGGLFKRSYHGRTEHSSHN